MNKDYITVKDFAGKDYGNIFFVDLDCMRNFIEIKIYVFGAGYDGQQVYKKLKKQMIEVVGFLDNGVHRGTKKN